MGFVPFISISSDIRVAAPLDGRFVSCCLRVFLEILSAFPPAFRPDSAISVLSESRGRMSVNLATALPNMPANPLGCDILKAEEVYKKKTWKPAHKIDSPIQIFCCKHNTVQWINDFSKFYTFFGTIN